MLFALVIVALFVAVFGYALTERMLFFYLFCVLMGISVVCAESLI